MPSAAIYASRKKHHRCVTCGTARTLRRRLHCQGCRTYFQAYRAQLAQPRVNAPRVEAPRTNQIAHCGRFHPALTLPFQCPTCGKTLEQILEKEVA